MNIYIATKPLRLDRDYEVGDEIPVSAINSKMEKRLIDWGKIRRVTIQAKDIAENAELNQPQANLLGSALQESVKDVEAILGISHSDETMPSLEERIEICKIRSAELSKPETADNRILGTEPDTVRNDIQDIADILPQNEAESATATPPDTEKQEFICEVCGKICGSKSALTSHAKTHKSS